MHCEWSTNLVSCAYDTLMDISLIVDLLRPLKTYLNVKFSPPWNIMRSCFVQTSRYKIMQFPLVLMGALTPRSVHARPSTPTLADILSWRRGAKIIFLAISWNSKHIPFFWKKPLKIKHPGSSNLLFNPKLNTPWTRCYKRTDRRNNRPPLPGIELLLQLKTPLIVDT
jgi:hypothetical protein